MILTRTTLALLLALAALAGCNGDPFAPGGGPDSSTSARRQDPKDVEIERLEAQIAALRGQVAELGARNDRLTEKLNQQTLIVGELNKQLAVVGDAPRERDRFRQIASGQQLEIDRLQRRIRTLEDLLGIPTATAPAGQPTPEENP